MWCRPSRPGPLRSCRAGSGRLGDRGAAAPGGHATRRPVAMSWTWAPLLALLLGACLWPACLAAPRDVPDDPMDITDKLENYLVRFGYAQESDPRGPAQMLDLSGAIKKLQAFAGIPVTGTLDPATQELLDKPRCGRRDIETGDDVHRLRHDKHQRARRARRYTVTPQGNKWHTIPVSWSLKTGVPPGLDKRQVIKEVRMALEVWARPANLSFAEDNKSPDIEVRFERGNHHDGFDFDGRGNILAHAFYPGTGLGGDVHLDWDERWLAQTNNPSNGRGGFYLFAVLAHELGHSLGLQHSSVEGAVMNAWYRDGLDAEHFELHEDDTFGIQQIYGPRDGRLWAKLPKYPKYPDYSPSPRPPQRPAIAPPVVPPPALPPLRPHDPAQPAKCNTDFDAAAVIRRETYFFKGKYFWRIQEQNIPEGPHLTERFWYGFDKNYTHIDAAYERIHDNNIVFFVGKKYYVYNGTNLISGYPKPLTELGLPPTLTHIDGAMVWGHNSRTYLFSGTLFWRLDEEVGKVELDYPRDMSMWRGVGYNVDAVLQKHGVTYFFKNKGYWKFDDRHMRVEQCMPKNIAASWMGCKEPEGKWSDWEENYLDILRDSKDCFYDIAVNDDDGDSAACQAINIVVFWLSLLVSFYFAF